VVLNFARGKRMDKDEKGMLSKDDALRIFGDKHRIIVGLEGGPAPPTLQRTRAMPAGADWTGCEVCVARS
jgi:hypothetical protein